MMLRTEMSLELVDTGSLLHSNLTSIYTTAQRSANLVKQLLGYARKQMVIPTVLDLNAAVEGMLPMLRKLIGEEVEVGWTPDADLWPVKVDASQVDQIVTNLCVNGRDAIDGIGTISIKTANVTLPAVAHDGTADVAAGDYVLMTVRIRAAAWTPEVLEHIFEPFYTTKEVGKGVGLGLATVDGIVHQNGGHIEVDEPAGCRHHLHHLPAAPCRGRSRNARRDGAGRAEAGHGQDGAAGRGRGGRARLDGRGAAHGSAIPC